MRNIIYRSAIFETPISFNSIKFVDDISYSIRYNYVTQTKRIISRGKRRLDRKNERMTGTFFITPHMEAIKRVPDLSSTTHTLAECIVFTFAIYSMCDNRARKTGIYRSVRTVNNGERLEACQTVFN